MSAVERVSKASSLEQANENRLASGPVLAARFSIVLDHGALMCMAFLLTLRLSAPETLSPFAAPLAHVSTIKSRNRPCRWSCRIKRLVTWDTYYWSNTGECGLATNWFLFTWFERRGNACWMMIRIHCLSWNTNTDIVLFLHPMCFYSMMKHSYFRIQQLW